MKGEQMTRLGIEYWMKIKTTEGTIEGFYTSEEAAIEILEGEGYEVLGVVS